MDFEIFTMVPTWVHPRQQHYVVSMWMWEWGSEPEKIFYDILSHGHGWKFCMKVLEQRWVVKVFVG
jgi:hypothetical protein